MHAKFLLPSLLVLLPTLAPAAAVAMDDAAAVAARVQAAWLRGADSELALLAAANARWAQSANAQEQYALAFTHFRVLQMAVTRKNDKTASAAHEACVASAGKAAELAKTGALAAEARALQSACYGYVAGIGGTFAAIRNGRASGKAMEQALALEARNPRVILVDAFGRYFRPKIAGGDKVKACARFREAAAAMAAAVPAALGGWGPAEAMFWRGRCLRDAGDAAGARREFEAALRLSPEFAAAQRALKTVP
jgi:tetratricopeptide (TPR) repeat protein